MSSDALPTQHDQSKMHPDGNRTRIKVCGLTRLQDVHDAQNLGVDALGFVFYPPSKRYLTAEQAYQLVRGLPAFVTTVALFVDPTPEHVNEVIQVMRPTMLQFHGAESPQVCAQYKLPYIKAVRVGAPGLDTPQGIYAYCQQYQDAAGWLFDSFTPAYGGSGHGFDRSMIQQVARDPLSRPIIVSGGLTTEVVAQVIDDLNPWALDVSSGVESSPGVKSLTKMQAFVKRVNRFD